MENEIVRTITLKASLDKVWSAVSEPQKFGEWFRCTVDGLFEVGQVVDCSSTYEGNEESVWQKVIKAIEPKSYFAFAWSPGDTGADMYSEGVGQTLVEFFLESTDEGTVLKIRESGFADLPEEHRARSFRMNNEGWDAQVENIKKYVDQ